VATRPSGDAPRQHPAHDASSRAGLIAASIVAIVAVTGYAAPTVGAVVPACLSVAILACVPIATGWSGGRQVVVATAGVAGHLWIASTASASSLDVFAEALGLGIGAAVSIVATLHLREQRTAEDARIVRLLDAVQHALGGLVVQSGARRESHRPDTTAATPAPEAMVEEIVAACGRIGAALEQFRQRETTDVSREREMSANFIGQAAHEFRTPLAVIQTATEALKLFNGRMSSHLQQERLVTIEECVQEMSQLLHNSLSFSRLDGAKLKCERQPVDVRKLAQEVVEDVQSRFGAREIVLTVRGAARLPYLDPSLAREILSNLLTNAVKYSPGGEPVEVDAHVAADEVKFRVVDHGIGIPTADLPYIFDAFRRADNVGEIAGTGLGLAITKRAAEVHGGTITAESQPGQGTTFTVTLPERVKGAAIEPSRAA
jgi:signal transduction histidine kinase